MRSMVTSMNILPTPGICAIHRMTIGLTSIVAVAILCGIPVPADAADPPNIVLILADDLGWHQTGCYGSSFYETPNIDRLASQGMRFTAAYAACPVCSPTRASIMTGKYPARLHLTDYIPGSDAAAKGAKLRLPAWTKQLPLEEVTIAEALKSTGYRTGHFGKWHLNVDKKYQPGRPGDPGSQGFDDVLTTHKPGAGPGSRYEHDEHHVREITERALAFLENNRDQPFFCYVPHNSIHRPLRERDELIAKYQAKPGSDQPEHNPTVAAMVETLDASIGQILDKLDELELTDNTLVIYFSDNGCMWGPDELKPLRGGKADLYEGGIRVPMVVRWPGVVEPATVCETPVSSVDFFPTLLKCAGVSPPETEIDGVSLLPLLRQTGGLTREAIYWHYPHYHSLGEGPSGAIRRGRYKLIEWFEQSIDGIETPAAVELFDLVQDISEQHNLASEQPELAGELAEQLRQWRAQVGAQSMALNESDAANLPPKRKRVRWAGATAAPHSTYRVSHMQENPVIDAAWNKPAWKSITPVTLEYFMGSEPEHQPQVQVRAAYDDDALYLIWKVEDRYVRAQYTQHQQSVCKDSCVEFFFTPGGDPADRRYINLETNCAGIKLLGIHDPEEKRRQVSAADFARIETATSLAGPIDPEIGEPTTWTLEYRIPFSLIEQFTNAERPQPGVRWRANFYKCADATSHPHWLTWSPVDHPTPAFHLPEFFGVLEFE